MKETGNPATGCVLPESVSDSDYYSRNDSRDDSEKDEERPERKMKSCCSTDIANSGVVVNIPIRSPDKFKTQGNVFYGVTAHHRDLAHP